MLQDRKVIALGERDGISGTAIAASVSSKLGLIIGSHLVHPVKSG